MQRAWIIVWEALLLGALGLASGRPAPLPLASRSLLQASPQMSQQCANGFTLAYSFCSDVTAHVPGSLCCSGLQQLGTDCFASVLVSLSGSPDSSASVGVTGTLQSCGLSDGGLSPSPAPSPKNTTDASLPDGTVRVTWSHAGSDGVTCQGYRTGDFVDGTGPAWVASASDPPTDAEIQALGDSWCADRGAALDAFLAGMDAGGHSAGVAFAAMIHYACPSDQAELWDWLGDAIINSGPAQAQDTALRYAREMVAAADLAGENFCVTLVVTNSTGGAVFQEAVHVGPGSDTPEGCTLGFRQAMDTCSAEAPAPGVLCCAALAALGDTCRASLASDTSLDIGMPFNLAARRLAKLRRVRLHRRR
ncbi:hypothetical protein ABPG75_008514 [Micractinium tetrahymenae]